MTGAGKHKYSHGDRRRTKEVAVVRCQQRGILSLKVVLKVRLRGVLIFRRVWSGIHRHDGNHRGKER